MPGAGIMKPCALLKLDFLTSACIQQMHVLVRKSSFSKAQGLHNTGHRSLTAGLSPGMSSFQNAVMRFFF